MLSEACFLLRKVAGGPDAVLELVERGLVRMTELDSRATVVTLDEDFRVYRKEGRRAVPAVLPPKR